jgi:hypothetical protein
MAFLCFAVLAEVLPQLHEAGLVTDRQVVMAASLCAGIREHASDAGEGWPELLHPLCERIGEIRVVNFVRAAETPSPYEPGP